MYFWSVIILQAMATREGSLIQGVILMSDWSREGIFSPIVRKIGFYLTGLFCLPLDQPAG